MSLPNFLSNLSQLATRPMTVQRAEWASNAFWKISNMRTACIPYEGGERVYYIEADDLKRSFKLEADKIMTVDGWRKHLELYEKGKEGFASIEKEIAKLSDNANQEDVLDVYKKWTELLNLWGIFGFCPFAVEGVIDPTFRESISGFSKDEQEKIIATVSSPSKLNAYQEMRLEITEASFSQDFSKVKDLVSKYNWYSEYSFVEPLLDEEYFITEIKKIDSVKAKEEKEKILYDVEENKKNYTLLLEKISDSQTRLLAEILHTYTFLRTDRIDIYKKGQSQIRRVYQLVAKLLLEKTREEWTIAHIANLTNNEIKAFLENDITPKKKDIDIRLSGKYIYLFDNGEPQIFIDDESINEARKLMHKEVAQEIKGAIAYRGKVSGKVAMVKTKDDLIKVKEGSILVSRITMPDYTPAMKIASAFVTEEGGITSHAAIIARELKKPCVIGTKIATQVLRDGQEVEIDDNNFLIKILK